jgi:hypothetical protein
MRYTPKFVKERKDEYVLGTQYVSHEEHRVQIGSGVHPAS